LPHAQCATHTYAFTQVYKGGKKNSTDVHKYIYLFIFSSNELKLFAVIVYHILD